jgi:hypothetical protein
MTKAKPVKKGKKLGTVKPLMRGAMPSIKPLMKLN